MRQHQEGLAINARDRSYVADEIELVVERRVDSVGSAYQGNVYPSGAAFDRLGGDTASAYAVSMMKGWPEPLEWRKEAPKYVGRAASGKADDDAHWAGRLRLCPGQARPPAERQCSQRDAESACGETSWHARLSDPGDDQHLA
jgi:hypothetical protein